ncbi:hypothetical protein AAE478_003243 [Parahypoxylon ruwenzoriense]
MRVNIFQATSLVFLVGAQASTIPPAILTDYGYWDINVTAGSAASGYRWGDVYAEYSGTPGEISHTDWIWDPHNGGMLNTTSDNPNFGSSMVDNIVEQSIEVQQSVILDGVNVTLVGSGVLNMKCGLGGSGRSCEGSVQLPAGKKEEEK